MASATMLTSSQPAFDVRPDGFSRLPISTTRMTVQVAFFSLHLLKTTLRDRVCVYS